MQKTQRSQRNAKRYYLISASSHATIVLVFRIDESGLWRSQEFVRQDILITVDEDRLRGLDMTELKGMDRLRDCEDEEGKVNL